MTPAQRAVIETAEAFACPETGAPCLIPYTCTEVVSPTACRVVCKKIPASALLPQQESKQSAALDAEDRKP